MTDLPIEFHGHNDLGLATANTLAAIEAGAAAVSVSVNGLGERAGNAALEQVATALDATSGRVHGVHLPALRHLSGLVAMHSGTETARAQPIVGRDVFTHESGIHVAGMLKSRDCYEGLAPELLGRKHRFVIGKHSGLSGLRHELSHLGMRMTDAELRQLLPAIRAYCETNKRPVPAFTVLRFAASLIDERERRKGRQPGAQAAFAEVS